MIAGDITPLEVGRAYRCDANLNLTSAEVARIRLRAIVRQDREACPCYVARRIRGLWYGAEFRFYGGDDEVDFSPPKFRWHKPRWRLERRR